MYTDLGFGTPKMKMKLRVYTDSSAARGHSLRKGLGRMRHIDMYYMWVQQRIARGDFVLDKVDGSVNCADMMTKYLNADRLYKLMLLHNLHYQAGRAELCPALAHFFAYCFNEY